MTDEEALKAAIVRIDSNPVMQEAREALEVGATLDEVRECYELTDEQMTDLEIIADACRKRK